MGNWTALIPEAGTNLCINPSFEIDTTGWSADWGDTLTAVTGQGRYGIRSLQIAENGTASWGARFDATVVAGQPCSVSMWIRMAGTYDGSDPVVRVYDGASYVTLLGSSTAITERAQWVKRTVLNVTPATTTLRVIIFATTAPTIGRLGFIDGVLIQQADHITTYIDGDQPGCYWTGVAHGSTSIRDAQYRQGGKEIDLEATYGVKIEGNPGIGVPPMTNNLQPLAIQPGALFQSTKINPRTIDLIISANVDYGDALSTLYQKRDNIINLFNPFGYRGAQPVTLGYQGANANVTAYADFRYDAGLEFTALMGRNEKIPLRLLGENPYWRIDNQELAALDFQDTLASDSAFGRINGAWQRFGSGMSASTSCIAIDYQHNRIYFGGVFQTANGVTVNGIAYWDGTTFQPLGAATKGVGAAGIGQVFAIAIAPNGDVWAGGNFTTAGGSATKGLAKWAYPGTGAPTVFNTATSFTEITSIVIDKNYKVYISGTFTVFMGVANASYIASTVDQGTTWAALTATVATGGTPWIKAMALDLDGISIYFGGDFTAIGGVANTARIAKWNGSVITALSTGAADGAVNSLVVDPTGILYAGGSFTATPGAFLAKWNGVAWTNLSETDTVLSVDWDSAHNLLVYISSVVVGVKLYNGSTTSVYDFTTSGAFASRASIRFHKLTTDLYVSNGNVGVSTTESGLTTVTPTSTALTYPKLIITGPTTAATSCTVNFIENQSTQHRLYFSGLTINSGETVTIDFTPGNKSIISNWRGSLIATLLDNSDFAQFVLLPGANTLATYFTGTITGVSAILIWQPVFLSPDGVA